MRAPGMTLMKMPIFVWSVLSSMLLVIIAFPILTATLALLSWTALQGCISLPPTLAEMP
jgi:cytochrome o ubiquinol oxidase subunit 1